MGKFKINSFQMRVLNAFLRVLNTILINKYKHDSCVYLFIVLQVYWRLQNKTNETTSMEWYVRIQSHGILPTIIPNKFFIFIFWSSRPVFESEYVHSVFYGLLNTLFV